PTGRLEGFPMVLVEALFSGLPIVAFDQGGVSDAVLNNETGFLIKERNINIFSEKTKLLLEDKDIKNRFSRNARKFAEDNFTLDTMLDKYESVINKVLT
ncbi:glycosyltransferase, partial [Patescibacteria group bacterium]